MIKSVPPPGQNTVSPYLVVKGADQLVDFLKKVFGAEEKYLMRGPGDIIMHGEVRIGESVIMLAEACEKAVPRPAMLHVYVPDVDAAYARALAAGAVSEREPANQFYGDRSAGVTDIFGNSWYLATPAEEISPEELQRRHEERIKNQGGD
jgi:PhnB protein